MTTCLTIDLGLIGYAEAYALQRRIVAARKAGAIEDVLLLCEHPHVITQGRNGKREHLLAGENVLRQKGVEFHETSRGGDVTYHGPGQIVGYPILNLAAIRRDVVWYVRMLEEVMIRASADFGVAGHPRNRQDRNLGSSECSGRGPSRALCRLANRETWRNRRTHQPLGHLARFCLQCLHRFALLRSDRSLRHRGSKSDFS